MAKHLIYKQKVTLHLSKKDEVYALQDRVSRMLQNGLMDGLETVLDNAFPADKVVRIDKLQLDLGTISLHNFESEFKAQFISILTKSLSAKKESLNGTKDGEAIFTKAQATENALIFFLENGRLPWYSQANKKADWETEILENLSAAEYRHFFDWIKKNQEEQPVIIERLVLQFSDKFIAGLLATMVPGLSEPWELIFADFLSVIKKFIAASDRKQAAKFENPSQPETFNSTLGKLAARDKVWQYIIRIVAENEKNDPILRILNLVFSYIGITPETFISVEADAIKSGLKTQIVQQALGELTEQFMSEKESLRNEQKNYKAPNISPQENEGEDDVASTIDLEKENIEIPKRSQSPDKKAISVTKKMGPKEGDIVYVNNCGVVMLHPFLKPFFDGLELAAAGTFLNGEAHSRAVLLLHYIATGETDIAEFDLTLQKILCGYPLENTLPAQIILTDKELTETNNLLKAVLGHWEPLKNTSIEGFCSTFLQRPGSLELKDSGWLLTVEQKTIDILLGKLPWGFSTIRLPWMQEMLSVDWH